MFIPVGDLDAEKFAEKLDEEDGVRAADADPADIIGLDGGTLGVSLFLLVPDEAELVVDSETGVEAVTVVEREWENTILVDDDPRGLPLPEIDRVTDPDSGTVIEEDTVVVADDDSDVDVDFVMVGGPEMLAYPELVVITLALEVTEIAVVVEGEGETVIEEDASADGATEVDDDIVGKFDVLIQPEQVPVEDDDTDIGRDCESVTVTEPELDEVTVLDGGIVGELDLVCETEVTVVAEIWETVEDGDTEVVNV